jgi:hypothetical protein
MKIKTDKPKIKAMAFGGCSFTWGQGLHYYSALDSIVPDTSYGYNSILHSVVHHLFREKWRWPSRVANHFGTVALTHYKNGGANDLIVDYWDACFRHSFEARVGSFNKLETHVMTQPIKYSDVSHFVFQFTSWMRTKFPVPVNGQTKFLDSYDVADVNRPDYVEAFEKYFESLASEPSVKNTALGEFHRGIIKKDVDDAKQLLQRLEEQGIKTYVLCWPWEHSELIENDEWLSSRFIKFNYNNKTYRCLEEMMRDEVGLSIETDYDFFDEPPIDGHPRFKCHQLIADTVIKFIEENNG